MIKGGASLYADNDILARTHSVGVAVAGDVGVHLDWYCCWSNWSLKVITLLFPAFLFCHSCWIFLYGLWNCIRCEVTRVLMADKSCGWGGARIMLVTQLLRNAIGITFLCTCSVERGGCYINSANGMERYPSNSSGGVVLVYTLVLTVQRWA